MGVEGALRRIATPKPKARELSPPKDPPPDGWWVRFEELTERAGELERQLAAIDSMPEGEGLAEAVRIVAESDCIAKEAELLTARAERDDMLLRQEVARLKAKKREQEATG